MRLLYYRELNIMINELDDEQKEEAKVIIEHYLKQFKNSGLDYDELDNAIHLKNSYEAEMKGVHPKFVDNQKAELYLKDLLEQTNNNDYYLLFMAMYGKIGQKYRDY